MLDCRPHLPKAAIFVYCYVFFALLLRGLWIRHGNSASTIFQTNPSLFTALFERTFLKVQWIYAGSIFPKQSTWHEPLLFNQISPATPRHQSHPQTPKRPPKEKFQLPIIPDFAPEYASFSFQALNAKADIRLKVNTACQPYRTVPATTLVHGLQFCLADVDCLGVVFTSGRTQSTATLCASNTEISSEDIEKVARVLEEQQQRQQDEEWEEIGFHSNNRAGMFGQTRSLLGLHLGRKILPGPKQRSKKTLPKGLNLNLALLQLSPPPPPASSSLLCGSLKVVSTSLTSYAGSEEKPNTGLNTTGVKVVKTRLINLNNNNNSKHEPSSTRDIWYENEMELEQVQEQEKRRQGHGGCVVAAWKREQQPPPPCGSTYCKVST